MVTFLAGAHGVGKSFLGRPVADALGFRYATASALIQEELGASSWDSRKHVQGIDRNQEALIAAVARIGAAERNFILDGHFVLRDAEGKLVPLPIEVFERLRLKGAILLEATASIVSKRLAERSSHQELISIEELASAELQNAVKVCQKLRIPLIRLDMPDEAQLISAIQSLAI